MFINLLNNVPLATVDKNIENLFKAKFIDQPAGN